jgi:hypothetical protein
MSPVIFQSLPFIITYDSPLCVSVSVSKAPVFFFTKISVTRLYANPNIHNLTCWHLKRSYFQMRSHLHVSGVRISTYLSKRTTKTTVVTFKNIESCSFSFSHNISYFGCLRYKQNQVLSVLQMQGSHNRGSKWSILVSCWLLLPLDLMPGLGRHLYTLTLSVAWETQLPS